MSVPNGRSLSPLQISTLAIAETRCVMLAYSSTLAFLKHIRAAAEWKSRGQLATLMLTVILMLSRARINKQAKLLLEMSIDRLKIMQKQDTYRSMTVSCTDLRQAGCPTVESKSLVAASSSILSQAPTSEIQTRRRSFPQAQDQSSTSIKMQNGKGK